MCSDHLIIQGKRDPARLAHGARLAKKRLGKCLIKKQIVPVDQSLFVLGIRDLLSEVHFDFGLAEGVQNILLVKPKRLVQHRQLTRRFIEGGYLSCIANDHLSHVCTLVQRSLLNDVRAARIPLGNTKNLLHPDVFSASDPMQPLVVGYWQPVDHPNWSHDMWGHAFVSGNYAYIADPHQPFDVVDISAKNSPNRVGFITTAGMPWDVVAVGDYAYVASATSGLQVIDVGNKSNPQVHASLPNPGDYTDYWWVRVSGDHAFLAGSSALAVIDIKDSAHPSLAGLTTAYKTNTIDSNFDLFGDYVCIGDGSGSLQIVGFK